MWRTTGLVVVAAISGVLGGLTTRPAAKFPDSLTLSTKDGLPKLDLSVDDNGGKIIFLDKRGRPRLMIGLSPDGKPAVALTDNEGQVRLGLEVDGNHPQICLSNGKDKSQMLLGHSVDNEFLLSVRDKFGADRLLLGVTQGDAGLSVFDAQGKHRASAIVPFDGVSSGFWVVNSDGHMIWGTPNDGGFRAGPMPRGR
jgi:hypothetical protein